LATITKNEQVSATERQREESDVKETIKAEWYLVYAGFAQTAALTATLLAVLYQAIKTADAAKASGDSVAAIQRQSGIMERSTVATEKSVLLQEIAMQQWLESKNWSTNYLTRAENGFDVLEINFELANPTDWPLTLLATKMRHKARERMDIHRVILTPNLRYTVKSASVSLTEEQKAEYYDAGITLMIFGCITYRDCFEKVREQVFSGSLRCSMNGVAFTAEWLPDNPYLPQQSESQNPN
jgi:hypothetical protein